MIQSRSRASASSHLEALRAQHAALSRAIEEQSRSPGADDLDIKRMKSKRLLLKDKMAEIRQAS